MKVATIGQRLQHPILGSACRVCLHKRVHLTSRPSHLYPILGSVGKVHLPGRSGPSRPTLTSASPNGCSSPTNTGFANRPKDRADLKLEQLLGHPNGSLGRWGRRCAIRTRPRQVARPDSQPRPQTPGQEDPQPRHHVLSLWKPVGLKLFLV